MRFAVFLLLSVLVLAGCTPKSQTPPPASPTLRTSSVQTSQQREMEKALGATGLEAVDIGYYDFLPKELSFDFGRCVGKVTKESENTYSVALFFGDLTNPIATATVTGSTPLSPREQQALRGSAVRCS